MANKTNEVKKEEVKTNEVKTNEVKKEEVKTNEVKKEEVKTNEVKKNKFICHECGTSFDKKPTKNCPICLMAASHIKPF